MTGSREQLKRMADFLQELGINYKTLTPQTQKYLLEYDNDLSSTISGSAMNTFTQELNKGVQSGGRVMLPAEYFGLTSDAYVKDPGFTTTSGEIVHARAGIAQHGGSVSKLYTSKDYPKFKSQYENMFLRKLRMSDQMKTHLINKVNTDVTQKIMSSIKQNGGNLTMTNLKKAFKN